MDLGLSGKTALVTAASRGLGHAAAVALAQEGARVSIYSRGQDIKEVAAEIEAKTGSESVGVQCDLTDSEQIKSLADSVMDRFGQLDILIVSSGGPPPRDFLDLDPKTWRAAIDLTLMSAVNLLYEFIPPMIEAGSGSIVTTQSYSVKQPIDRLVLTNSLRLAVIGLMKSLANELGPAGIRVNSINPAWTWTERVQELMKDRAASMSTTIAEEKSKVGQGIPLGSMGTVEEFGRTIAWLASPAASFIHGHALMFDEGATRSPI